MEKQFFYVLGVDQYIRRYVMYPKKGFEKFLDSIIDRYSFQSVIELGDTSLIPNIVEVYSKRMQYDEIVKISGIDDGNTKLKGKHYPEIYKILGTSGSLDSTTKDKNIIRELKYWCFDIPGLDIDSIREHIYDSHITEEEKKKILIELFSLVEFEELNAISIYELSINELRKFNIFNFMPKYLKEENKTMLRILQEISKENYMFFRAIGLDPENIGKNAIVVSNIHGLLANKNLFTGKITHVTKCFNNNNDASKEHVYYEESEFVDIADEYVEATAEDIYTYRENYYLPDGTRPFLDMTIEEIERYLKENN